MQREEFIEHIVPMRDSLVAVACRYCPAADAEDVVQDTMIRLWTIAGRIDAAHNYRALAATAVRHAAINRAKALGRLCFDAEGMDRLADGGPYDDEWDRRYEAVLRLIDSLNHRLALIMKMRHVDRLETEEIARIAGMTPEAVRMAVSRGRRQIRELYFKENNHAK